MIAKTEEQLEWASQHLGVPFRDPTERRQKAFAALVDSGFAPDAETACAISFLLHYQPGEPLNAPLMDLTVLRDSAKAQLRARVLSELQNIPNLHLSERKELYHRLRREASVDPWLMRRVDRTFDLVIGDLQTVDSGDPRRLLVFSPSEAVLMRPAPPTPPPQILKDDARQRPESPHSSRPAVANPFNPTLSPLQSALVILGFLAFVSILLFVSEFKTQSRTPGKSEPESGRSIPIPDIRMLVPQSRVIFTTPDGLQRVWVVPQVITPDTIQQFQELFEPGSASLQNLPLLSDPPSPNPNVSPVAP